MENVETLFDLVDKNNLKQFKEEVLSYKYTQSDLNIAFMKSCILNQIDFVNFYFDNHLISNEQYISRCLKDTVEFGHCDIIKVLLDRGNIEVNKSAFEATRTALELDNLKIFKLLYKHCFDDNTKILFFILSYEHDYKNVFEYLLTKPEIISYLKEAQHELYFQRILKEKIDRF